MKTEDIKIDEDVAHQIWLKGIKHPPRKIRVLLTKTDEGYVLVSKYEDVETKVETPKNEKPSLDTKKDETTSETKEIETDVVQATETPEVTEKPKPTKESKPKPTKESKPKPTKESKPTKSKAEKPKKKSK